METIVVVEEDGVCGGLDDDGRGGCAPKRSEEERAQAEWAGVDGARFGLALLRSAMAFSFPGTKGGR